MKNSEFKDNLMKRAKAFSLGVLRHTDTLDTNRTGVAVMVKQVIRSATSIGANIVEAQGAPTERDFGHFLSHALKSANETVYWFELLHDYTATEGTAELGQEALELSRILGSVVSTIKKRQ